MKRSRTPWAAKLRPDMQTAVVTDPKGRGRMLLPTPLLVAKEISAIPPGQLRTVSQLREGLANHAGTELVCPLMTGIFFNIVAGAAEDDIAAGRTPLAPYWRVVRDDGSLSPKTPAGPERQAEHLRAEGHAITAGREKLAVASLQT